MKIVTQDCHRSVATTRSRSVRARALRVASALLLLGAAAGCQNNETPPPLPTAKPAASPSAVTLEIPKDEDAGAAKKPKVKGTGGKSQGALGACCSALRQNAASAPPETQGHMLNAAAACDAANAAGTGKAGFGGVLSGLLRGAGMPPACK